MGQVNEQPTEIAIRIRYGEPVAERSRHLSGRRRAHARTPACPSCGTEMLCVVSVDTADPVLRGHAIFESGDADLIVCPCCSMYLAGYHVRGTADSLEVSYEGPTEEPPCKVVVPYPVAPVALQVVDETQASTSPDVLASMEARELGEGIYHRFTPYPYWAIVDGKTMCPLCSEEMKQVAIIDTDRKLEIAIDFGDVEGALTLNWIDGYYLQVSFCRRCRVYGYRPAHG